MRKKTSLPQTRKKKPSGAAYRKARRERTAAESGITEEKLLAMSALPTRRLQTAQDCLDEMGRVYRAGSRGLLTPQAWNARIYNLLQMAGIARYLEELRELQDIRTALIATASNRLTEIGPIPDDSVIDVDQSQESEHEV